MKLYRFIPSEGSVFTHEQLCSIGNLLGPETGKHVSFIVEPKSDRAYYPYYRRSVEPGTYGIMTWEGESIASGIANAPMALGINFQVDITELNTISKATD
jgi:hypothetical protein